MAGSVGANLNRLCLRNIGSLYIRCAGRNVRINVEYRRETKQAVPEQNT